MSAISKASLTINTVELNWDENSRRKEKPCIRCGKPTRGRMSGVGGIKKPAHAACAIVAAFDKSKQLAGGAS
jgi:hypothetical protein